MKKVDLVIGCWLLVISNWLLVIGRQVVQSRNRLALIPLLIMQVFMLCFLNATAQDATAELQKISEWYLARQSFESSFDYILYTDAGMKKQVEKQQGMYCRTGNKSYMKGLATETMNNETYSVTVNHQEKMILASKTATKAGGTELDQAELLKQYMAGTHTLSYKKLDNNHSEITIQKEAGPYAAVKVIYNHKQHILTELHLLFRNTDGINWSYGTKQPYLVIRYHGLKYDHRISPSLFDEKRFVTITAGSKVKPAPAFSRYQVFSTIN